MDLEVVTHLLVIVFIVGDFAYHGFKAWQKRKRNKGKKLYTLDEAKVVLFESVALADPQTFAFPERVKFNGN